MELYFSFIIPVYNRPDEVQELLDSISKQTYQDPFEIVIVEDGSTQSSEQVVAAFEKTLSITYLQKPNTGPGHSRNYGMSRAQGNYFIVLDSDCILPPAYLSAVAQALKEEYVDCFGGPDAAHSSFSNIQKAINYSMTSFLTTGGIRGNKKAVGKFQPRSFNMGISKKAFEATQGFGNIHPGEDPDLTIRIWNKGFATKLIPHAYVFHKRRIDWSKFFVQVHKFGLVRPILNSWHPQTAKFTYWFPSLFFLGAIIALLLFPLGWWMGLWNWGYTIPLMAYVLYFLVLFCDAWIKNKSVQIGSYAVWAAIIQFAGYGLGFLKSTILINFSKKKAEVLFPKLFFKTNSTI
ncbi:glycosyltransferase [Spongiimicrobium salis]|uniref:glycosyltransferase n=1 Tax=Spongiimicrobium salis TaxID=1667022 RepID=UPI00374DBD12